jgi:hypothetical protein
VPVDGDAVTCAARLLVVQKAAAIPVAADVADLLAEVGGLTPEAARRAADVLLDPACYPVDYLANVLRLGRGTAEEFIRGLYLLFFDREADAGSLAGYLRVLGRGMPRRAVLRRLALSPEAGASGLPLFWLAAAEKPLSHLPPPGRRVKLLDRVRVLATRLAWAVTHRLRRQAA